MWILLGWFPAFISATLGLWYYLVMSTLWCLSMPPLPFGHHSHTNNNTNNNTSIQRKTTELVKSPGMYTQVQAVVGERGGSRRGWHSLFCLYTLGVVQTVIPTVVILLNGAEQRKWGKNRIYWYTIAIHHGWAARGVLGAGMLGATQLSLTAP